jgi:hypothetical protein
VEQYTEGNTFPVVRYRKTITGSILEIILRVNKAASNSNFIKTNYEPLLLHVAISVTGGQNK